MLNVPPPAYYQTIDRDERRGVASLYSEDAKKTEGLFLSALNHLHSTPFAVFKASSDERSYNVPPPQARRKMKVKLKFIGNGLPLPVDYNLEQ